MSGWGAARMEDIILIGIGAGLVGFWLMTLLVLWKLIDRQGRPGPVTSALAKEGLMLAHLIVLVTGTAMIIRGLRVFG